MAAARRGRTDDEALWARAQGRDGIAFSRLVERHYPRLVLVAEGIVRVGWLAEYCAQEALAEAMETLAQAPSWPRLQVRLYRRVVALAMFRRLGARALAAAEAPAPVPLATLAVWLLREHGGLSYDQLAEVSGCRVATVQRRLAQARGILASPPRAGRTPGDPIGRAM